MAHDDMVCLSCPDRPEGRHGGLRYSTWWTLKTEQAVLDAVEAGSAALVAIAADHHVEAAVAELGADQAEAVRRLCASGERVSVMVGPAGSGKSASLAAARRAWESSGITVRGVAPSAVAAGVLAEQAGIASETLAKFLLDADEDALGAGRLGQEHETGEVTGGDHGRFVADDHLTRPEGGPALKASNKPTGTATPRSSPTGQIPNERLLRPRPHSDHGDRRT